MFMSPSVGRKNGPKRDDESQLILNSPSSDSEANSILNGNHQPSSIGSTIDVGFVFPNVKLKKTPVSQVSECSVLNKALLTFESFCGKIVLILSLDGVSAKSNHNNLDSS